MNKCPGKIYTVPVVTAVLSILFIFSACESPSEVSLSHFEEESSYFEFVMKNNDFFTSEEDILNDPADEFVSDAASGSDGEVDFIEINRIARRVHNIERSFSHEFVNDTLVIVTMTRSMDMRLWINGDVENGTPYFSNNTATIFKDFTETTTRKAKFLRVDNTNTAEDDWKLVEVSLLDGGTAERDFEIHQMKLQFGEDHSFEYDDPLNTFMRIGLGKRDVPAVKLSQFDNSGFEIEVTIQSSHEKPERLYARHGGVGAGPDNMDGYMRRIDFPDKPESEEYSNGIYTRTYVIDRDQFFQGMHPAASMRGDHMRKGRFSTVVEVISHESLYDTEAPVHTSYWGVPFIIE